MSFCKFPYSPLGKGRQTEKGKSSTLVHRSRRHRYKKQGNMMTV